MLQKNNLHQVVEENWHGVKKQANTLFQGIILPVGGRRQLQPWGGWSTQVCKPAALPVNTELKVNHA